MKRNYPKLLAICENASDLTDTVINDIVLLYTIDMKWMRQELIQRLAPFAHLADSDQAHSMRLQIQYAIHRIFRKDGFIRKLLNHVALDNLTGKEREFLELQMNTPWRFSYSTVTANPFPDFYEMQDVFTSESFLLHSPGVTEFLEQHPVALWFNLIGFNGVCWQTYGIIGAYEAFDADDIFFYATEVNSRISSDEDLVVDIEKNPVPYQMLSRSSGRSLVVDGGNPLIHVCSTFKTGKLDVVLLQRPLASEQKDISIS